MMTTILTSPMTMEQLLICLCAAIILGILNACVFMFKSVHSSSFGLALALLPMVVCLIIMLVNGNVGTGIAVAGAFTLVRFRSVPGTAKEIAAIFVSMALGLALGMGYVGIAIIAFVVAAAVTLILTALDFGSMSHTTKQLKVTLPENYDFNGLFDDLFDKYAHRVTMQKVRTTNMGTLFEVTYEIELKGMEVPKEFLDEIRKRNGNLSVAVQNIADRDML